MINFDFKGCSAKGTMFHQVSTCEVIAKRNGVELHEISILEKIHWEVYMDGELVNKYYNLKTAKQMWKDFSC